MMAGNTTRPKEQPDMLTITNKLRTIVALGAIGAALAGSGVASAQPINPQEVGSAGVAGYDDAMCESLANDHNKAESAGIQAVKDGDASAAQANIDNANGIQSDLEENCLVID
jgi:hypothetical protein